MLTAADVMVISAHPDDAEIGIAGTVAQWTRQGRQVVYIVCTSGEKGTSDRSLQPEELACIREKEQLAAAQILGVHAVKFLRYSDQGLEDTPEFRKQIVRLIRMYRPAIVATSDPYRRYIWHRDHRIIGQVALDAVYPLARDHLAYPDLLEAGLEPHNVQEMLFWAAEDVNYRSDITSTFDLKLAALRCHATQVKGFGISDVEAWLRDFCRKMAAGENFELAEAFHRVKIYGHPVSADNSPD
ncbi:MAG: PIG-L family deacetylase [Desulfobacterales bacterium]|uniref:PIG-L family deacetylase n=1 Tax=Candidatus Desulfatibia profunda TaxID=2841695 RepID=A0A8J6TNT2_9BACT|nr:PIG-L family deacetylase [Candidatus Desulfatibia profunda]MBL7179298.1 PIG-L family deacetylase [Desulfobacterales bacterium]